MKMKDGCEVCTICLGLQADHERNLWRRYEGDDASGRPGQGIVDVDLDSTDNLPCFFIIFLSSFYCLWSSIIQYLLYDLLHNQI
jgi:hypothetical protein